MEYCLSYNKDATFICDSSLSNCEFLGRACEQKMKDASHAVPHAEPFATQMI